MDTGNSRRSCLPDRGRQRCVAGACWPAQTLREEETQVTQCLLDEVLVCESILEASSVLSDRVGAEQSACTRRVASSPLRTPTRTSWTETTD